MRTEETRRFGIADGLILIAGVAAGFGAIKALTPEINLQQLWHAIVEPDQGWSASYALLFGMEVGVVYGIPFVSAWTPFCLIVQLVKPRPAWRRLRRQPGFVACLVATIALVLNVVIWAISFWFSTYLATHSVPEFYIVAYVPGGFLAGSGVLWSWVTMMLCRVCRPRRTWTDRLGRITGVAWVAVGTASAVYFVLILM